MLLVNKQFSNNDQTLLHHKSLDEDSTPRDFFYHKVAQGMTSYKIIPKYLLVMASSPQLTDTAVYANTPIVGLPKHSFSFLGFSLGNG